MKADFRRFRNIGIRLKRTAACLLAVGMAVQIGTGLLWIVCNFPPKWTCPESEYYLQVSGRWVLDEYTGVLYPALLWLCRGLGKWFGLPFEGLLCLIQLTAAFLCGYAFLRLSGIGKKKWQALLGGLCLLTIPICVQWHLSVLPQSLTCSLTLLLLGLCARAALEGGAQDNSRSGWRRVIFPLQIGALWAGLILLDPDQWWLGLVPVLFGTLFLLGKGRGKALLVYAALTAAAGVLAAAVNTAVQTPGSGGKIQKSLGAAMVSRLVWPNFETTYYFWPEEIKEVMTMEQGRDISLYADQVQRVFGPMVEQAYGLKEADRLYWQMAVSCLEVRTRETLSAVGEDFVSYLFAPWRVKDQLDGSGRSYSGWNYGKMKTETPRLARWYMDYGLFGFRVGMAVSALLLLAYAAGRYGGRTQGDLAGRMEGGLAGRVDGGLAGRFHRGGKGKVAVMFSCCILWNALWYTMRGAGMMDYRYAALTSVLWYCIILGAWFLPDNAK